MRQKHGFAPAIVLPYNEGPTLQRSGVHRMSNEPPGGHNELPFRKFLRRSANTPAVRSKEMLILGAIGFAAALVLMLSVPALRKMEWRFSTGRQAPIVVPAPAEAVPAEAEARLDISLLSRQALAGRVTFRRRIILEPPFQPVEARIFRTETEVVRLGGIDGPAAEAVCEDDSKALWACGLQARAALNNLIRLDNVQCEPFVFEGSDEAAAAGPAASKCFSRGLNVAVELVRAGFARPAGLPDRAMAAAEGEARAAGRGLWRGGWRVVR